MAPSWWKGKLSHVKTTCEIEPALFYQEQGEWHEEIQKDWLDSTK
jgi:hypothetical protein